MNSYFPKIGSELRYTDARRGSAAHIPRSSFACAMLRARYLFVCLPFVHWLTGAVPRCTSGERAKHQQIYASLVNGEAEHQLRHRSTAQKQSTPVRHNQSLSLLAVWSGSRGATVRARATVWAVTPCMNWLVHLCCTSRDLYCFIDLKSHSLGDLECAGDIAGRFVLKRRERLLYKTLI